MRKKQAVGILLVLIIMIGMAVFLLGPDRVSEQEDPVTCTLLRVGKADAIILQSGGYTAVIDTGEEEDGEEILSFMRQRDVLQIDLMIITHYDKDHVGGADTLAAGIPVSKLLLPDYESGSTEYIEFIRAAREAGIIPEYVTAPVQMTLGAMQILVEPPDSYEIPDGAEEYDNNFSLLTTVTHGENVFYFTGDIEKERIRELVSADRIPACTFLKVPHHGIYQTQLEELIRRTNPDYAAICTSDKNPADPETLELLKKYGVDTVETRYGDITVLSNGKNMEIRQRIRE